MKIVNKRVYKGYMRHLLKDKEENEDICLSPQFYSYVRSFFIQAYYSDLTWDDSGVSSTLNENEDCAYIILITDLIDTLRSFFVECDGTKAGNYIRVSFFSADEDMAIFVKDSDLIYVSGQWRPFAEGKFLNPEEVPPKNESYIYDIYDFEDKYRGHKKTLDHIFQYQKMMDERPGGECKTYFIHSHEDFFKKAIKGYEENIIDILDDDFLSDLAFTKGYQEKYKQVRQFGLEKGWLN